MFARIFASAGLATAAYFKSSCSVCNSKLTWNQDCLVDGKPVCGSCGQDFEAISHKGHEVMPKGRCCKKHIENYNQKLCLRRAEVDKLVNAIAEAVNVKLYPLNYKGTVPATELGKGIKTDWYNDRDEAEFEIKVLAALDGCRYVKKVEFHKDTGRRGNYKFTVWQATGVI